MTALLPLVDSFAFQHTLKNFPGGATSAGVMKGLQAVLVFVVTSWVFCGRTGGEEMCFTGLKFASLVAVVSGVLTYAKATERRMQASGSDGGGGRAAKYAAVAAQDES